MSGSRPSLLAQTDRRVLLSAAAMPLTFPTRPRTAYQAAPPPFAQPVEVACFSYDAAKNAYLNDRRSLVCLATPLSLNCATGREADAAARPRRHLENVPLAPACAVRVDRPE